MGGRTTKGDGATKSSCRGEAERVESVPGEPAVRSWRLSSNCNVRSRALPLPLSKVTVFLHCIRSLSTDSRTENVRSFRRRPSCSRPLVVDDVLSRVLTRSRPVMLFSRLRAAASRSGQSDLLTNSNCACATSCIDDGGPGVRFEEDDKGRERSKGFGTSSTGVAAVSLKRSNVAATLRPMPAVEVDGAANS